MFEGWSEYFFMIGSSAASLIGLMFVVVTLTAGRDRQEMEPGKKLYTSPIVCHLAVIVMLSGASVAPTMTAEVLGYACMAVAVLGVAAGVYISIGISRSKLAVESSVYDVCWYGLVPAATYIALGAAGYWLLGGSPWGVSAVAGVLLALLLVSIHNEWDLVTFLAPIATVAGQPEEGESKD